MTEEYESNLKNLIRQVVNEELGGFKDSFTEYMRNDIEWKKTAQPYINIASDSKGFLSVGKYIIIGLTSIGVFFVTILEIIHLYMKTK